MLSFSERWEAIKIPVTRTPDYSTLPNPPGHITISNVTRSSVGLRWTRPQGSPPDRSPEPTHYRVEYFCHDMGPGKIMISDICDKKTLTGGTEIQIVILIKNVSKLDVSKVEGPTY